MERIDESARTATPWAYFAIAMGSSVALGNLVWGWLPITFGLGFWAGLTAMIAGTLVGQVLIVPLILLGSRTATNNSTSSGAQFGVRGRLIGATIGALIMTLNTALITWVDGSVTAGLVARLFGTQVTELSLGICYAVIAFAVFAIGVYGFHLLVRVSAVLMVAGGVVLLLMPVAFAGKLNPGYAGGDYLLGSFWKTWILAAITIGVSGVLQLSTIMGDSTRYISPRRHSGAKLVSIASLGIFLSFIVPPGLGTLITTAFADPYAPFPESLASAAPTWYVVILLPTALFGGLSYAGATVYSSGLDLNAILPRLSRAKATAIMMAVSVGLIYVGSFVWNAADSLAAASLILLVIIAPWAAIVGIGFLACRGRYHLDDLQVFNRGQRGGAYWYSAGWNWRAVVSWAVGSICGILAVHTTLYVGPLADLADGVDVSFVGSFVISGVLYVILNKLSTRQPVPAAG